MQEVLNSSLGIYQAVYVLFTSNNIGELILAFLCFVVGLLTYAPRNGRDMGDFRVFGA